MDNGERVVKPFTPIIIEETVIENVINDDNSGQFIVQDISPLITTSDGDLITNDTFNVAPMLGSTLFITVNGVSLYPANGESEMATAQFYVMDSTGVTVRSNGGYEVGDIFKFNGSIVEYELETDDVVKLNYEI